MNLSQRPQNPGGKGSKAKKGLRRVVSKGHGKDVPRVVLSTGLSMCNL